MSSECKRGLSPVSLAPLACLLMTMSRALHIENSHMAGQGDVRCFCNLPECIVTGYMCKSESAGCFSDVVGYSDAFRGRHGCLELIDRKRHDHCYNKTSFIRLRAPLMCCHQDMCNHVDSPDFARRLNETFGSLIPIDGTRLYFNGGHSTEPNNNEVWFKAATIAVPICGALILLVLVVLAIKLLRKEQDTLAHHRDIFPSHMNRKPCQDFERNMEIYSKKIPLLLQHHNEPMSSRAIVDSRARVRNEKNEANAKINSAGKPNQPQPNDYTILVSQHQDVIQKPSNLVRNVNLAFAVPTHQSVREADKNYDKGHLSPLTSWGDTSEPASHV